MTGNTEAYREAEARFWRSYGGRLPEERRIRLARLDLEVRVLEIGEGPALAFLHGGPNAASTWAPLAAHLTDFRCLLVDRPGCGLSDAPPRPPKRVRDHMVTFMDDLSDAFEGSVTGVVASSFGSFTTIAHQVEHPQKALPSVHFGCPALAPGSKVPIRFLLQGLPGFGWVMTRMQPPTLETARKSFAWIGHGVSLAKGRIPRVGLEWYAALLANTSTRKNDFAMFGNIRPGRDQLTEQDLARVSVPTSLFWGEDDMFGGADVARRMAGTIPGASLELVAESGHLPWLDFPEMAADHVRQFFSESLSQDPTATE